MTLKALLAAAVLAVPLLAGTAARAQQMINGSLIEALNAIGKTELGGVFSFVSEKDSTSAFSDLLARDPKALKRYAAKLDDDRAAATGLTAWDHQVCATLVNFYTAGSIPGTKRPDSKRLKSLNACVLAPVMELQEIVSRRNK